jgi:hypothetical protein
MVSAADQETKTRNRVRKVLMEVTYAEHALFGCNAIQFEMSQKFWRIKTAPSSGSKCKPSKKSTKIRRKAEITALPNT